MHLSFIQASELHQLQAAEQERLAEGAPTAAIDKSKKLAEIEAQRRNQALYRKYTIEEIKEGTNNFDPSLKIGEGGYDPVFKAKLDHTPVAIKVLRPDAKQGKQQFQQEVDILSRMRHPNLVLLLGACPEYGCLIYEFMNYGSLEDRLIRRNNTPSMPWQIRFSIAADIATGLLFLHQAKPEPLVHRDLKPGNILLDCNYVCKIADVGLARLVPSSIADSVTQYHMTSAAGTFCYIDPEYQQTGQLGVKSDVYSLGVMLLQVITARPPMGLTHIVGQAISKGNFVDVLDPTVPDWPVEEALTFANVALMCAKLMKKDRSDLGSFILPELDKLREFGINPESSQDDYFSPMSDSLNPGSRTSSPFSHEVSNFLIKLHIQTFGLIA
ncbi:U-box domain-containing protein 35-like protein isoform X2 [Tanacetum coccineum]